MGCGCGKPSCRSCGPKSCCGNVSSPTPIQPYCGPTVSCPENHCQEIITQQFAAALKIVNSWNVPNCGGSATLYVSGLISVAVGSFLWNSQYGYFEVVGFDKETNQITVENSCIDGNAPEGTNVPACTYFIVTDAPLEAGGGGSPGIFPFVAIDFTAPLVGDCLLITVTNVNGLVVGKNVQIGSGTYRIESIPDGTHIVICNDGLGITPGTAVIAKNAANQYQYPIILIDANPCTNDPVDEGCLVVCKDNIMSPLGGLWKAGAVPTIIADDSCDVEFKLLEVPTKTCTTITCCLTLQNGVADYIINVADSSQFTVGDILQIGTRTDRAEVTAIPDGTHIEVTITPTPGALVDIDPGTSICIVDCCELIEIFLESEEFRCGDFENRLEADGLEGDSGAPVELSTGNTTASTGALILVVNNASECREMFAHFVIFSQVNGTAEDSNTDPLTLDHSMGFSLVTNPPPQIVGGSTTIFNKTDAEWPWSNHRVFAGVVGPIAGGGTANIIFDAELIWTGTGSALFNLPEGALYVNASVFGVAV